MTTKILPPVRKMNCSVWIFRLKKCILVGVHRFLVQRNETVKKQRKGGKEKREMSRRAVCFNSTQLVGQLFCFSCGGSQNLLQCTVCNENFCVPCGMGLESRSGRCTEGHTFEKKAPRAESARARPGTSVHHYVPGGNNAFRAGSPPTTTTRKWGDGSSSPRTFRATSPRRDFRLGGRRPQTSELTESRDKIEQKTTPPIDETISLKVSVDFRLETEKEDEEEEKEENDEESTDEEEENDTTKTKEEPQIRKQESILKIQSQRAKDTNTILSTFRTLPPRSQKKLLDELKLVIKRGFFLSFYSKKE